MSGNWRSFFLLSWLWPISGFFRQITISEEQIFHWPFSESFIYLLEFGGKNVKIESYSGWRWMIFEKVVGEKKNIEIDPFSWEGAKPVFLGRPNRKSEEKSAIFGNSHIFFQFVCQRFWQGPRLPGCLFKRPYPKYSFSWQDQNIFAFGQILLATSGNPPELTFRARNVSWCTLDKFAKSAVSLSPRSPERRLKVSSAKVKKVFPFFASLLAYKRGRKLFSRGEIENIQIETEPSYFFLCRGEEKVTGKRRSFQIQEKKLFYLEKEVFELELMKWRGRNFSLTTAEKTSWH